MRLLEWKHKIFDPKRRAAYDEFKKQQMMDIKKKKEVMRIERLAENRILRRKLT